MEDMQQLETQETTEEVKEVTEEVVTEETPVEVEMFQVSIEN